MEIMNIDCGSVASFKPRPRKGRSLPELAREPYHPKPDQGRHDADDPHAVARAMRRFVHGPPHSFRESRKQKALDRKSEAEGCNKIQHQGLFIEQELAGREPAEPAPREPEGRPLPRSAGPSRR